jgi:hypothetical protein
MFVVRRRLLVESAGAIMGTLANDLGRCLDVSEGFWIGKRAVE